MSCNRVNGVSVSATLPSYHLSLHYVTSVRGQDHSVTYMFSSTYKFQYITVLWCSEFFCSDIYYIVKDLGFVFTTVVMHSNIVCGGLIGDYGKQIDYRYVLYMTPLQKTRTIPLKTLSMGWSSFCAFVCVVFRVRKAFDCTRGFPQPHVLFSWLRSNSCSIMWAHL